MGGSLAIIPIIVNTGAAILPAILAAVATTISLLFKPRELFRACRRRPYAPVIVLAVGAAIWLGWWGAGKLSAGGRNRRGGAVVGVNWSELAMGIIREQKGGFRLAWRYYPPWVDEDGKEAEDTEAMILSSPLVRGRWVYGASCRLDPPDNYGSIFCLDVATGKRKWFFNTIADEEIKGFFSSPAVSADGTRLVIGQGLHPDSDCRLICLDADTGELMWTVLVSLHIESSPAIAGDLVVVGAGAIESPSTHKPISHAGFVLGVRLSDGKELWRYDLADPESSPALVDGVAYIGSGFNGQAVVALRTETDAELAARGVKREIWRRDTNYPITGPVRIFGDLVVVGGGNRDFIHSDPNPAGVVLALDRATGAVRWERPTADAVLGGAVAVGGKLIFPVANGDVIALSEADGEILWRQRISGNAPVLAGLALGDGCVWAVSKDGYLAKLALADGEILEKRFINATPGEQGLSVSTPTVVGDRLYVGSETGGLRCYVGASEE